MDSANWRSAGCGLRACCTSVATVRARRGCSRPPRRSHPPSRLADRFRFANLPTGATLDDFDHASGIDPSLPAELATCRYLDTATNGLLLCPPGVGKTRISADLGHAAVNAGDRVYFTSAADLAARCPRAAIEGKWGTGPWRGGRSSRGSRGNRTRRSFF